MLANEDIGRIKFRLNQASASGGTLRPTLYFNVELSYTYAVKGKTEGIIIFPSVLRFATGKQICNLISEPQVTSLLEGSTYINLVAELDYYLISQIEANRKGDLEMEIFVKFADVSNLHNLCQFHMRGITISKSDWVEKFLADFKYKEVMLFELPKLTNPEWGIVVEHFNKAFVKKQLGEDKEVLSECRQAMEALKVIAKKNSVIKTVKNSNEEEVEIIDYEKILGDDSGKAISDIHKKLMSFLTPGSHHGKSISKEDSEFCLMVTYALINLVLKKM
jgi:hypothetical protein